MANFENKVILVDAGPPSPKGDKGDPGAGAATLQPIIDKLIDPTGAVVNIYYNNTNGNDANDGLSATSPIQTMQRLEALLPSYGTAQIWCLSDFVADWRFFTTRMPDMCKFFGRFASNAGFVRRKIIVRDALNHGNRPGGFSVANGCGFLTNFMDWEFETTRTFGFFEIDVVEVDVRMTNSTMNLAAGAGEAAIFHSKEGGGARVSTSNFSRGNAAGHVFSNVAADVDPSTTYEWRTNLVAG